MPRKSKLDLWFKFYIDKSNKSTFLNKTAAARAAGYKCRDNEGFGNIGYQNSVKLSPRMNTWLDEVGLSDEALKEKLLQLSEAKETKFIKIKGYLDPKDLPDNIKAIGTSGFAETDKEGNVEYSAGDTLIEIETDALGIQTKNLEMALKVKGLFSPEEINLNANLKGIKIEFVDSDKNE